MAVHQACAKKQDKTQSRLSAQHIEQQNIASLNGRWALNRMVERKASGCMVGMQLKARQIAVVVCRATWRGQRT